MMMMVVAAVVAAVVVAVVAVAVAVVAVVVAVAVAVAMVLCMRRWVTAVAPTQIWAVALVGSAMVVVVAAGESPRRSLLLTQTWSRLCDRAKPRSLRLRYCFPGMREQGPWLVGEPCLMFAMARGRALPDVCHGSWASPA